MYVRYLFFGVCRHLRTNAHAYRGAPSKAQMRERCPRSVRAGRSVCSARPEQLPFPQRSLPRERFPRRSIPAQARTGGPVATNHVESILFAFAAAVFAGGLNSVAGGGSFISFPALLFVGLPPIVANATNNTAMWLGTLSSVGGYREEFGAPRRRFVPALAVAAAGGVIGAILLLVTPEATFSRMIPYLLLVATLIFAASDVLRRFGRSLEAHPVAISARLFGPLFVVAIYGGYFGAGVGILILALLALVGWTEIHRMNAVKVLLAACINGVAVVPFALAGKVAWTIAFVVAAGAMLGGYFGARVARKTQPVVVRAFVLAVGTAMTIYFFVRPA